MEIKSIKLNFESESIKSIVVHFDDNTGKVYDIVGISSIAAGDDARSYVNYMVEPHEEITKSEN